MKHFNDALQKFGFRTLDFRDMSIPDHGSLDLYFAQVEKQFGVDLKNPADMQLDGDSTIQGATND